LIRRLGFLCRRLNPRRLAAGWPVTLKSLERAVDVPPVSGKRLLVMVFALLAVVVGALAAEASADHVTVASNAPQPWAGGAKSLTPIEAIAARIASRIAGHPVSVSCEGVPRFRSSDGTDALGLVRTLVDSTGRYAASATVIELTSRVCGPLQRFAQAAQKPTRCLDSQSDALVPCFLGTRVARGSVTPAVCWDAGCYGVVASRPGYWSAYGRYSFAILTLAHEAIHTQQAIAGRPRPAPDLVETQADCYGMQWMRWVAEQLGASSDDAQSIATFFWHVQYPQAASLHTSRPYWSVDCRPGGKLDIRSADATAWP
jgi:hypothetical protein